MTDGNRGLDALLAHLRDARGFDFTGYKPSSLQRRLRRRMDAVGTETYEEYLDHLQVHPDEFDHLFDTILINVTGFFRDPQSWDVVASHVIPAMVDAKSDDEPIRVWSAGSASGEEAYTVAMLLDQAVGTEAFRGRVKIYATDVDEHALEQARLGSYDAGRLEDVPEDFRDRYFE